MLRIQGIDFHYFQIFKVNYRATFFGLFLPGAISGDAIRIAIGSALIPKQKIVIALSVFVDRLVGALSLFSITFFTLIIFLVKNINQFGSAIIFYCLGVTLFSGLLTISFIILFSSRLSNFSREKNWQNGNFFQKLITNIVESIILYRNCPMQMALCYGLSLVVHTTRLLAIYVLAVSMEMMDVNFLAYILAGCVSLVANFIPITPGGIGLGEATFSKIVGSLAIADHQAAHGTVILAIRAFEAILLFPTIMMKIEYENFNFFKFLNKS